MELPLFIFFLNCCNINSLTKKKSYFVWEMGTLKKLEARANSTSSLCLSYQNKT